jgi:hypothetical protein
MLKLPRNRLLARASKIFPVYPQPSHHSLINTSRLPITNRGKPASDHFRVAYGPEVA